MARPLSSTSFSLPINLPKRVAYLRSVTSTPKSVPCFRSSDCYWFSRSATICCLNVHRRLRFVCCAGKNDGENEFDGRDKGEIVEDEDLREARGRSTMPERFRYLTKEVPDRPLRWPWIVALVFLLYAWRAVLWELTNWKRSSVLVFRFSVYVSKFVLAFILHYVGGPITNFIRCIEYCLYSLRWIYASTVAFAPVPELTRIILFATTILSIGETVVPDSVNNQPYLLSFAGFIGFGAVRGFVPAFLFWFLLAGMFCYSHFAKKRDIVSSALPSAAVLAAIGEPWVRGITSVSYLSLAIIQYSKTAKQNMTKENSNKRTRIPFPLFLAALAIGTKLAAKWIRNRHLTWMIA